jgi:hypothetical protein
VETLQVDLRASGSILGIVTNVSSQPVSGAVIEVFDGVEDEGYVVAPVVSDADGFYTFDRVQPTAVNEGYVVRASLIYGEGYRFFAEVTDIVVTPNSQIQVNLQSESL